MKLAYPARATCAPGSHWGDTSFEEVRGLLHEFADERDWHQFHTPRNLLMAMTGELGELAEVFQWKGEVAPGLPGLSVCLCVFVFSLSLLL